MPGNAKPHQRRSSIKMRFFTAVAKYAAMSSDSNETTDDSTQLETALDEEEDKKDKRQVSGDLPFGPEGAILVGLDDDIE